MEGSDITMTTKNATIKKSPLLDEKSINKEFTKFINQQIKNDNGIWCKNCRTQFKKPINEYTVAEIMQEDYMLRYYLTFLVENFYPYDKDNININQVMSYVIEYYENFPDVDTNTLIINYNSLVNLIGKFILLG